MGGCQASFEWKAEVPSAVTHLAYGWDSNIRERHSGFILKSKKAPLGLFSLYI